MEDPLKKRSYRIRNSEKCYRFKPVALVNHAPERKGIFELVTFDEEEKYFDFIDEWNAVTEDDAKDIYWWLVKKYDPLFNTDKALLDHSGRPGDIDVVEI